MDRDPAIHVRRSDLLRLCKEEGITFPEDFVDNLMIKASKVKLHSRVSITAKSPTRAKAARTVATDDNIVSGFNGVYTQALINHNKRARPILKGTKQYLTMKEVATQANDFVKDYKLPQVEGFQMYVGLGIILVGINKITITRLKGADQKIRTRYDNMQIMSKVDPIQTQLMLSAWDRSLKNFHNMSLELNIDQMGDIAWAAQDAIEAKADPKDWMDAQFDRWTFLNSMPEFSQIHGDGAKLAYVKYMAGQKQEFINDGERQHFETLKDEKAIPIKGQKRQRSED